MGKEVSVMDKAVITFDSREFQEMPKPARKTARKAVVKKPVVKNATGTDEMNMEGDGELTLSDMSMMLEKLMPLIEEVEKLKTSLNGNHEEEMMMEEEETEEEMMMEEDMTEEDMTEEDMAEEDMAEDEEEEDMAEDEEEENGMDSLHKKVISMEKALARMSKKNRGMDSNIIRSINRRDDLARKLSHFVGGI